MLIIEPTNEELPSGILKAENIVAAVLWSIIRICDYTEENGPTLIWPDTHKTLRILCKSGAYCDPTLYEPMLAEWPVKSALRISSCFQKAPPSPTPLWRAALRKRLQCRLPACTVDADEKVGNLFCK